MREQVELGELFRERGLKVTSQREAVFRALRGNDGHPTADLLHAAVTAELPHVSLRTVYQVLNELTAMGEIQALELGTGAARFDPNVDDHHHLVCASCGRVRDIPASPVGVPVSAPGFTVEAAEVVFRGRCDDCPPAPDRLDTHIPQPRRAPCPT